MPTATRLWIPCLALAAALTACGKAPSAPAVPVAPAPTAVAAPAAAPEAASILASNTGRVAPVVKAAKPAGREVVYSPSAATAAEPASAEAPEAPLALVPGADEAPAPGEALVPAEGPDDPPFMIASFDALEEAPSYRVDDRVPYGVVVAERSAHTTTIAWRTEVPTRGIIEYGRAWGFDKNGYTAQFVDDVAKTDHQITLTELRRWTGYVYRVTAVTPLGLKFSEQERRFRTKFWSWR